MGALACAVLAGATSTAVGGGTLATSDSRSWSENTGWISWGLGPQPATLNDTFLSGFIWGENIGWVSLGVAGGPPNGTSYAVDQSSTDYGVNIDPSTGDLSGFAYGENVGWINFNTAPAIGSEAAYYDADAGRLRGYAWGENIGWINFDSEEDGKFVAFNPPACPGDLDGDNMVGSTDLNILLAAFGSTAAGDIDNDGDTDSTDLNLLLVAFGDSC
jgi:hypothetical protein